MNIIDLIEKKKRAEELTGDEIAYFVKGVTDFTLPDYQISALLMAILLKGMSERETVDLTNYMALSGERADLSGINGITADKHSTGGVGDSTTFIVIPALAALGFKVAKMSGRALGHTGGTIDKLESIPGIRLEMTSKEIENAINSSGVCICAQSLNICPADKRLYAIRDVTATVDSIPLIASSIMSKKIAGGAENIVLDIKCGNGAFLTDEAKAVKLGRLMVGIGKSLAKKITAVVTDMNEPLDEYIGNRLELIGALKVLKGAKNRLYDVSIALIAPLAGKALGISYDEAVERAAAVIDSGKAYEKFIELIVSQGGDIKYIENIEDIPLNSYEVISDRSGYVCAIDTKRLGRTLIALGGGRTSLNDTINYDAGLIINKRYGDYVERGESLARVYSSKEYPGVMSEILSAYTISDAPPVKRPLIIETIK
ncbi:MAG: thymidine phosphorylase [Christensenellales bacterium]|jgi:pyrimidine-nucleoside phosphorylase